MTTFTVQGKVIHFSNHGDHATVAVAVDADANDALVQPAEGESAGAPYLSFKVGAGDIDRPELREGATVKLSFSAPAAADDAAAGDKAPAAGKAPAGK